MGDKGFATAPVVNIQKYTDTNLLTFYIDVATSIPSLSQTHNINKINTWVKLMFTIVVYGNVRTDFFGNSQLKSIPWKNY